MWNIVKTSKFQVGLVIKTYILHLHVAHLKDLKPSNVKHTNEEGTSVLKVLVVFSITPFKIDQNKNQNCSIDKVQILRKERS